MSFNTNISGTAVAGEAVYSDNMPYSISTGQQAANAAALGVAAASGGAVNPNSLLGGATVATSGYVDAYERHQNINAQIQTLTSFSTSNPVTQLVDADNVTLLTNAGFQFIPDLGDDSYLAINRSNTYHFNPTIAGALGILFSG